MANVSQVMHKKPIIGSHYLPYRETCTRGLGLYLWWAFCMKTKDYLKYYWLEKYLEEEVQPFFEKEKYLTAEQFLAIIEWKNPKFGKTKLSYLKTKDIEKLFREVHDHHQSPEKQLEILINKKGIKLATASAILTILYPTKFTVYDIRVRKQLKKRGLWNEKPDDITNRIDVVDKYFNKYLPAVQKVKEENKILILRDCDRALWAQDWYEDLQKFLSK